MRLRYATAALALLAPFIVAAQDIHLNVTYICNGEHIYIENCNIRDTSDTSNCMVAHPDHLTPSGMNTYTYMTRGALKKLLPTCTQPTPQQLAAQAAFEKNSRQSSTRRRPNTTRRRHPLQAPRNPAERLTARSRRPRILRSARCAAASRRDATPRRAPATRFSECSLE